MPRDELIIRLLDEISGRGCHLKTSDCNEVEIGMWWRLLVILVHIHGVMLLLLLLLDKGLTLWWPNLGVSGHVNDGVLGFGAVRAGLECASWPIETR